MWSSLCSCWNNYLLIAPASLLVNFVPGFWQFQPFYAFLDYFCSQTTVWQGSVSQRVSSHSVYHQNAGRKSWTLGLFFSPNFLSVVFLLGLSVHWNFFYWTSVVRKYLFFPFLVKMFHNPARPGAVFDLKEREWEYWDVVLHCLVTLRYWNSEENQLSDI